METTSMRELVLFGVGSPLLNDYEETCQRLNISIAHSVQNVAGSHFVSEPDKLLEVQNLTDAILQKPTIVPLFTPAHRKFAHEAALAAGFTHFPALTDPTSIVARSCQLGAGVYINAGCTIGAKTTIGDFVLVNRHASLGHHVSVSDFVSIGPGVVAAGLIKIGRGAVIGAGAVILPEITIGENAVVAAGAVVQSDVAANSLVAGCPAIVKKSAIAGYGGQGI